MHRRLLILSVTAAVVLAAAAVGVPHPTAAAQAARCDDYSSQAAAQRGHDTRDADGDGRYCESLRCPCAYGNGGGGGSRRPSSADRATTTGCTRPRGVVAIGFSATKYP